MSEPRFRPRWALPVAAWGAFLLALAAVALIFRPDGPTIALGFGSGAAAVAAGLTVLQSRWRPGEGRPGTVEDVPDLSVATVVAAFGAANVIIGFAIGTWLLAIAAGILVAGLAGVAREVRAERRARRRAEAPR
jgi:hypothetical protein